MTPRRFDALSAAGARRGVRFGAGRALFFLLPALALAGCNTEAQEKKANAPPPKPEVGIVTVKTETVPLDTELVGRTAAFETSDVRPQVSGIVEARLFEEGARVEQGQKLYQIDPSLFEAAVAEAKANVESARATESQARVQADRLRPLARQGVTSAQSFDNAEAAANAARATLAQAEARLRTAEINLRYAEVSAPISGRIGRSLFTTGALVSANQAEPLATIQRLDPIFVDIQQSSAALLKLRRSVADGTAATDTAAVKLKLEDGSDYPLPGTLQFTEVTVAPDTGTVTVRARFPNPDGLLLPGMYVRAAITQSQAENAVLVPQQGIVRSAKGEASALVVGGDNKVERRVVSVERAVGDRWLVTQGLAAGDRLIVEGAGKAKPGAEVRTVDATGPGVDGGSNKNGGPNVPVAEAKNGATL